MMTSDDRTLIVVLGPTASGKSAAAVDIARHFGTEVISCDSRQFYREIPIGTAAPTLEEQGGVVHHFIGDRSLTDEYSAGRFAEDAQRLLDELFTRHKAVVMVGGSGLYINALCDGMDDIPSDPVIRLQLKETFEKEGIGPLREKLRELDPDYFAVVDKNNPQRIIRALEACLSGPSGRPYSSYRTGKRAGRDFNVVRIGLDMPRRQLYDRIDRRVDIMMEGGLEQEARAVYPLRRLNALQTVGYKELFEFFDGSISRSEAVELIKRNTRRYAKRQMTWFGRDERVNWFDTAPGYIDRIIDFLSPFVK